MQETPYLPTQMQICFLNGNGHRFFFSLLIPLGINDADDDDEGRRAAEGGNGGGRRGTERERMEAEEAEGGDGRTDGWDGGEGDGRTDGTDGTTNTEALHKLIVIGRTKDPPRLERRKVAQYSS